MTELITVEKYSYNEYGDVISYISPINTSDTAKTISYKSIQTGVENKYYIPIKTKYYKNSGEYIEEINYLSTDGKSILRKELRLNGSLVGLELYAYDERNDGKVVNKGNVIIKESFKEASKSISTVYKYEKGKVAEETTSGVTKKYKYDAIGNLISLTDGNGFTTSYEYGIMNRTLMFLKVTAVILKKINQSCLPLLLHLIKQVLITQSLR